MVIKTVVLYNMQVVQYYLHTVRIYLNKNKFTNIVYEYIHTYTV